MLTSSCRKVVTPQFCTRTQIFLLPFGSPLDKVATTSPETGQRASTQGLQQEPGMEPDHVRQQLGGLETTNARRAHGWLRRGHQCRRRCHGSACACNEEPAPPCSVSGRPRANEGSSARGNGAGGCEPPTGAEESAGGTAGCDTAHGTGAGISSNTLRARRRWAGEGTGTWRHLVARAVPRRAAGRSGGPPRLRGEGKRRGGEGESRRGLARWIL